MRRCAQCHGRLGLGVRFRNLWSGHGWVHLRFCSTRCEGIFKQDREEATLSVVGTPSSLQAVRGADSLSCSTHCDRADQRTENHPTPRRLRLGCATRRWPDPTAKTHRGPRMSRHRASKIQNFGRGRTSATPNKGHPCRFKSPIKFRQMGISAAC